ncbi:MAG: DUF4349 domain-containing protein [Bacteroidota bacterium]
MKTLIKILILPVLGILFFSCGRSSDRDAKMKESSKQDSVAPGIQYEVYDSEKKSTDTDDEGTKDDKGVSSSAAVENVKDTVHKFIRTADIKFRVRNVIHATYQIEDIVNTFSGFVTSTKLTSTVDKKTTTPVSVDSSLETTYYSVENSMVLRVPNTKLDTTLKSIAKLVDFMDYRNIKAEDVAIKILENKLAQKRIAKYSIRVDAASQNKSKDATEAVNTQDKLLAKEEAADKALISNLTLLDQIRYSTVTLLIYQRQSIRRELIPNDKNTSAYEPGFGTKFLESLKTGWNMIVAFIVFIVKLWALILFVVVAYIIYKWILKKYWKKDKEKS